MLSKKNLLIFISLFVSCIILFIVNLLTGFESITLSQLFSHQDEVQELIVSYRINKTLASVLAGIALPVSGFLMQELFKNPLAEPSILGISPASALLVALVIFIGLPPFLTKYEWLQSWAIIFSAFLGALLLSILLLFLSKKINNSSTFIIVGLLISSFCSSIIGALQFYSQSETLKQYVLWSFGSFEGLSNLHLSIYFICVLLGLVFAFFSVRKLIGFLLGEEYAKLIGVNIQLLKLSIIISVCLLTGSTTAMLGPIVFIGIIIPHFCRMLGNATLLWLQIILNIFVGSCFMLIINLIITKTLLPVNIISSIIGVPTILFILLTNKLKNWT